MFAGLHPHDSKRLIAALSAALAAVPLGCHHASDLGTPPAAAAAETRAVAQEAPRPDDARPAQRMFNDSTTLVVTGRPYVDEVELPGVTLRGIESTPIMAKIGGYVETIGETNGREIDIGTYVTPQTLLAVLKVPEREAELLEKKAALAHAEASVEQARARVEHSRRMLAVREAEAAQVQAQRAERQALVALRRAELKRIEALATDGAVRDELRDEAAYALAAAEAAARAIEADTKAAEARVAAAEAALQSAQADLAAARAERGVAQAALQRLQELLEYRKIRPPFPGIIVARNVDRGAFVQPAEDNAAAEPLFAISRVDVLRAIAFVPAALAAKLEPGQAAVLDQITGLPGIRIGTTVARVNAALERESRMLRIECDVRNPSIDLDTGVQVTRLMPGQFARLIVKVRSWEQLPIVPATALLTDNAGRSFVVLVDEKGPRRQRVQVVFNDGVEAGIGQGLEIGQRILRNPARDY